MSRSPRSIPFRSAVLAASLVAALGGCTSAASSASSPSHSASVPATSGTSPTTAPSNPAASPSQRPSAPPVTATEPAAGAPGPDATAPVSSPAGSSTAALITGIRSAAHPGYDRVVIDLTGPLPGYQVSYVNSLVTDASGQTVPVPGAAAFLRIRLAPANAHDPATGQSSFHGGQVTHLGLATVTDYVPTGDFEGVVSFGFALSHKAGFHIFTLTGPARIVIDFAS